MTHNVTSLFLLPKTGNKQTETVIKNQWQYHSKSIYNVTTDCANSRNANKVKIPYCFVDFFLNLIDPPNFNHPSTRISFIFTFVIFNVTINYHLYLLLTDLLIRIILNYYLFIILNRCICVRGMKSDIKQKGVWNSVHVR